MKTQKMTIKEIVDTIPARLGLDANEIDLSTPEKAYEFLRDSDFQVFAKFSGSDGIFDGGECSNAILEMGGYKSMYDVNNLFSECSTRREEMQEKYNVPETWTSVLSVEDEDGYVEFGSWLEKDLHIIEDNKWPYKIGFVEYGRFDKFIETVR